MIAAEIPALVISKIPVKTPIRPFLSASCIAPFTSWFPKLLMGTEAPAPANFTIGSYHPRPPRIAPVTTSVTIAWAGVIFNTSIRSWPITQIKPPTIKAQINFSKLKPTFHISIDTA